MSSYADMDAAELRHELDVWTAKTIEWSDELANAIDAHDMLRAVLLVHAYRQARTQMRRIRRYMQIGVA